MSATFSDPVIKAVSKIREQITDDKLETMLEACQTADYITQREREEIKDFHRLFNILKEKDVIRPDNLTAVKQLLEIVQRLDLIILLMEADSTPADGQGIQSPRQPSRTQNHIPPSGASPLAPNLVTVPEADTLGEDLSPYFAMLVEYIGRDWRFLGRQLKLKQYDFDSIIEGNPRNLRDQILAMLTEWKERNRKMATKAVLVKALRNCKMNLAADTLEKMSITST